MRAATLCARDVAVALGYKDPTNAIKQHCLGVAIHHPIVDNLGREPWFVAKDVCDALGIRTDTVRTILDDDEVSEAPNPNSIGVTHGRAPLIVTEGGLYTLVLRSRKPEAKAFKRWVTHELIGRSPSPSRWRASIVPTTNRQRATLARCPNVGR